jgi:hypothetical protein
MSAFSNQGLMEDLDEIRIAAGPDLCTISFFVSNIVYSDVLKIMLYLL